MLFRQQGTGDTIKVEFTTHETIVIIWGNNRPTIEVQNLEDDSNYG